MAVADEVWMLENSIYSILSPEGFASILWKDSKKAKQAAEVMKLTARDTEKGQHCGAGVGGAEKVFQGDTHRGDGAHAGKIRGFWIPMGAWMLRRCRITVTNGSAGCRE